MKNFLFLGIAFLLVGCSTANLLPEREVQKIPEQFYVKNISFQNDREEEIINWWKQFNDPTLLVLIEQAQKNSPTLSKAIVNLKNYENILALSENKLVPNYEAEASISKNIPSNSESSTKSINAVFKTSWELDLFNRNSMLVKKNKLEVNNAKANWYEVKTLVAAEVARSYFDYHFCKLSKKVLEENYDSKIKQAEITKFNIEAGFESKASLYTSEAILSEAKKNIVEKEASCKISLKGLVAMIGIDEQSLIEILKDNKPEYLNDEINLFIPISIPGKLIEQRPDIYAAKSQLEIDALNVAVQKLKDYPTISISGSISKSISKLDGLSLDDGSFTVGPLTIYIPIFDNGVRKKEKELSLQQYEQSKVEFSSKLRNAIKEIEVSLINLSTVKEKNTLDKTIIEGYNKSYEAALARYKVGLANLYEVEDFKRSYLNAVNSSILNKRQNFNAWIDLYKAVGGGFSESVFQNEQLKDNK